MAKTIKEMAVRDTGFIFGDANEYYVLGANAVLEKIEGCYDKNDSLCVIAHKIQSKIRELKGE